MKTWLVLIRISKQSPELTIVKAELPRIAINLLIDEYAMEGILKDYRIAFNGDNHVQFIHNNIETSTISFTVVNDIDLATIINELNDNESYSLEN